ncbi:MAG: (d)CMP kinase [Actinomycetota bacterium]|nr:(d)CMP kinase [Actinomycetota bacterium]
MFIIALDGPASSGKTTVARKLGEKLGLQVIDSGAMYRTVALLAVEREIPFDEKEELQKIASEVRENIKFVPSKDNTVSVFLGNRDITEEIRSPKVNAAVSPVSEVKEVREEMVKLQRSLARDPGVIAEGRDIGTTVFPNANLKIYLDASLGERVERRYREVRAKGLETSRSEIEEGIGGRDLIDSSREVSPLSKASDAITIDTTSLEVDEVVDEVVKKLKEKGVSF